MSRPFCHLHNHTEYSLLDGANRIPEMVAAAKDMGMEALAISDHGVMFGVMEFYFECRKKGIKPILGVEAYVAPGGYQKKGKGEEKDSFHLLLHARNLEGYRNLCKLSSIAALEGYYYRPRIDHDLLKQHSAGLMGTSACLGSEVCQELLKGNYDRAQYIAGMYSEIFGEGHYFIELQDHRLPEQAQIRGDLIRIARDLKLPLIATNDAHYLCKSDSKPHDVLLCIQMGELVANQNRMKFDTDEFYLKSPDEMAALFTDVPEAIENTMMAAELCNVELDKQQAPMPQPDVPEGKDNFEYLRELAVQGLQARMKHPEACLDRLNYELDVIKATGFGDYFLLVKEFAQATRDRGIYYGVRGSAAGSLVSYCVGITDVDPIEYDLTFERFLNPERISMPDIDMDFEDARRDEVIQYVNDRFGKDHVAQIITFGTLGAKAAIKDAGRVLGYAPQETDRLCKMIPTLPGWSIDRAMKEVAEFRDVVNGEARSRDLVETAKSVEGIARHAGVHAAGVVISRDPLVDYVPLFKGNDGQPVTAFEMGILEKIGLLKMDFLGLSNLTVLARAVENVKQTCGEDLDILKFPDDDEATFEMLARGETIGVFQLEGGGMTRWVTQLKPNSIRELAAMVALYRPGPMEHIPRFIDTKFERVKPQYLDERMRPILEETYGVIVYQDQVLKLVQALAGFSLGKADVLRRAMGKKDIGAMKEMKAEFLAGTDATGVTKDTADRVWELLLPFAGYAFNKAHAVCYAILAYQTAYLKSKYPVEYMAALLAVYRSKEDRVIAFIEECRRKKIAVLPPNVNLSGMDFQIEGDRAIRFGLVAIKGVGEGIVEAILAEREKEGPYTHLYEFADRVKPNGLNKTALEALIKAGALDDIDSNRHKLLHMAEAALMFADSSNKNRLAGQDSLFGGSSPEPMSVHYPVLPDMESESRSDRLAMEKEVMGIYVSDHPLRGHESTLRSASTHTCQAIMELEDNSFVKIAGVIASLRTIVTKAKGQKMATLTLEDFSGQAGLIAFPATYEKLKEALIKDTVVQVSGFVMHREMRGEKSVEIRIEDVKPVQAALSFDRPRETNAEGIVQIQIRRATPGQLQELKDLIEQNPGSYEVNIEILTDDNWGAINLTQHVKPSEEFMQRLHKQVSNAKVKVVELGNGAALIPN
jgi:DNA polymerase III subunit alpha